MNVPPESALCQPPTERSKESQAPAPDAARAGEGERPTAGVYQPPDPTPAQVTAVVTAAKHLRDKLAVGAPRDGILQGAGMAFLQLGRALNDCGYDPEQMLTDPGVDPDDVPIVTFPTGVWEDVHAALWSAYRLCHCPWLREPQPRKVLKHVIQSLSVTLRNGNGHRKSRE